jgi:signal peptidase I
LVVRQYVVEAFIAPTASMAPTIQPGDRVLVWKRPFVPQRGDLIVFLNPRDRREEYVKRLAAVAGETIEFRRDGAYINGALLDRQSFGGLPYEDAELPPSFRRWAIEGSPFTVPPGYVFVLGDNIGRSVDSRFFGPVPLSDVIGKAYKRYWPPQRAGPLE